MDDQTPFLNILNIENNWLFGLLKLKLKNIYIHMVDYLNAFDESYIPLNVQIGIEI